MLDLERVTTLVPQSFLAIVMLALGFFLASEIVASPLNFVAWIDFSEPIFRRAVQNVLLSIHHPSITATDLRSLEGFLRLLADSHRAMGQNYMSHLPHLFPGQDLNMDNNSQVYYFMQDQVIAEQLLEIVRLLADASSGSGG